MRVNSDTAHKLLKQINTEIGIETALEGNGMTYAHSSDEEPIIPEYNFNETHHRLTELHKRARHIKHAIGLFNQTTLIEIHGETMTIDEALSQMQWLNSRKRILEEMRNIPKTQRQNHFGKTDIVHRNFDMKDVQKTHEEISTLLIETQQAINIANLTTMFEI